MNGRAALAATLAVFRALDGAAAADGTGIAEADLDVHLSDDDVGWAVVEQILDEVALDRRGFELRRQIHGAKTTPTFAHRHGPGASITFYGPEFVHVSADPGSREWRVLQAIADAEGAAERSK